MDPQLPIMVQTIEGRPRKETAMYPILLFVLFLLAVHAIPSLSLVWLGVLALLVVYLGYKL